MSCKKIIDDPKYKSRPGPPYHANDCKHKVMSGNNGKQFVSRPDKNGSFKWYPIKMGMSPEEYYMQLNTGHVKKYVFPKSKLDVIKGELLKQNILFFNIGWKNVMDFIDYAWDDAEQLAEKTSIVKKLRKTDKDSFTMNLVSIIFYTEHRRYFSEIDGQLFLQHNVLKKDNKKVIEVFTKIFGKDFVWNGRNNKALLIKLHKR